MRAPCPSRWLLPGLVDCWGRRRGAGRRFACRAPAKVIGVAQAGGPGAGRCDGRLALDRVDAPPRPAAASAWAGGTLAGASCLRSTVMATGDPHAGA